jgi:hypothetical protein
MPVKKTTHQTSGGRGGGGINSRATAKVTTYHIGYPADRGSPAGVTRWAPREEITQRIPVGIWVVATRRRFFDGTFVRNGQPPLGNEVAVTTQCGVGGSRTVMKTGSQSQHGPAAGTAAPQRPDNSSARRRKNCVAKSTTVKPAHNSLPRGIN